ncbi:Zinc finger CCHC-type and RNA-binding motif-containing protein 1 [Desmophyllum pertusum]|uniref:Zinc finger CCHC-type and RNA-binding motif-containing protein 1 n=1 Tax=Desmophyllum pertusum TaxID=174260 RepID=A0A9W9ZQ69_9CNID|nr:Zinc finger CCHC-type and RNA-binding motif-containing protein 1 [Desmophyllum pertusum]
MSGGLAPSKSTVYVGNLPYSLTNNDLHKIFEKYGKVVKVTILRDKETRESKGVAFVLFLDRQTAQKAVAAVNKKQMFGRTIKCCIANDNGRTTEFIRRKDYPDKSQCYECGEYGHLSYECPKNMLGEREPPPKKQRKRKKEDEQYDDEEQEEEEEDGGEDPYEFSLSAVIDECARMASKDDPTNPGTSSSGGSSSNAKKKKIVKSSYFSDEEDED